MIIYNYVDIGYTRTIGKEVRKAHADVDHEVFKENKSYVEGALQDLSNYKHQWTIAKTQDDKLAIETVVRDQFANFDQNNIENPQLLRFLQMVLNK